MVAPDLDSLATALRVTSDDLLEESPHLAPWRPEAGIEPRLSDAERVTLSVRQALLGPGRNNRRNDLSVRRRVGGRGRG